MSDALARNPRIGLVEPVQQIDFPFERREVVVTEGIVDALSAAAGGYRAAAVLSASYGNAAAAAALARVPASSSLPSTPIRPDEQGRSGLSGS